MLEAAAKHPPVFFLCEQLQEVFYCAMLLTIL